MESHSVNLWGLDPFTQQNSLEIHPRCSVWGVFLFTTLSSAPRTLPGGCRLSINICWMNEWIPSTNRFNSIMCQQEMDILLKISWEDEENSSYVKPNDSTRNAHEGSSLLPSLVSLLSLPLLTPQNLLYYTSISISPSAYRSHWTKPKFWRWQNEAHLPFVRISFRVSAPPAFAGCIGRKCQLWWPKKSVIEVCIQVAGMEKSCDKCGSHSTNSLFYFKYLIRGWH